MGIGRALQRVLQARRMTRRIRGAKRTELAHVCDGSLATRLRFAGSSRDPLLLSDDPRMV